MPPRCVETESEPWLWPHLAPPPRPRASPESVLRIPPRKVMKRDTGTAGEGKMEELDPRSREGQPQAFPQP